MLAAALLLSLGASAPLTHLTDPLARCMDGTLGGFYHQPASNASAAAKWIIHLQGGGECTTKDACQKKAATSALGSASFFHDSYDFEGRFYMDDDPATNPELHHWHHVQVSASIRPPSSLPPHPRGALGGCDMRNFALF